MFINKISSQIFELWLNDDLHWGKLSRVVQVNYTENKQTNKKKHKISCEILA